MPEASLTTPATEGPTKPVLASGISIHEVETRRIWSIQGNRVHRLDSFVITVFKEDSQPGRMLLRDEWRLLQLWPHKAYLLTELSTLPPTIQAFESILTDISHGFCELKLRGDQVFEFIKQYVSIDINTSFLFESRNLRCRFGQYSILLWWDTQDDLRILVDRSYAQSFRNFLVQLMQRQDWNSI